MIAAPTERERERWREICEDWEAATAAGIAPRLPLAVAGLDLSGRLVAASWGSEEGSPAITVDAALAGDFGPALENADASLDCEVTDPELGRMVLPQMRGVAARPLPNTGDEGTTDLLLASAGSLLDKTTLDERVEYPGWAPSRVILDAYLRLGRGTYDAGQVRVDVAEGPVLSLVGDAGFVDETAPAEILAKVGEQAAFVFRDTAGGGAAAIPDPGLGEGLPVSREFLPGQVLEPSRAEPVEEQYTAVAVRRYFEDAEGNVDPSRYAVFARALVDHSLLARPPRGNRTEYVQFDDKSPGAERRARQIAHDRAERRRRGLYSRERVTAYDPRAEKFDAVTEYETVEEDMGRFGVLWLYLVRGYRHTLDEAGEIRTRWQTLAVPLRRLRLPDPPIRLPGVSAGNSRPSPGWGRDASGRWFFDEGLPWVSYDPETRHIEIDEVLAASWGVDAYYDGETFELVVNEVGEA